MQRGLIRSVVVNKTKKKVVCMYAPFSLLQESKGGCAAIDDGLIHPQKLGAGETDIRSIDFTWRALVIISPEMKPQFRVLLVNNKIHALLAERYHLALRMIEPRQTYGYLEYSVCVCALFSV